MTDSPWFWAYVFATAGLAALLLAWPKYHERQQQIERHYRGRVALRHATEIPGVVASTDDRSETFIPLWPLGLVCALVLAFLAVRRVAWRPSHRSNDVSIDRLPGKIPDDFAKR